MADPKFTDKDIDRLNKAFADTNTQAENLYDKLVDTLNISKQITDQYKSTANRIDRVNLKIDKTKAAIEEHKIAIAKNEKQYQDLGKQIQENIAMVEKYTNQENAIKQETLRIDQELVRINNEKREIQKDLIELNSDIERNSDIQKQIGIDAIANLEERLKFENLINGLKESQAKHGEGGMMFDEMMKEYQAQLVEKQKEGDQIEQRRLEMDAERNAMLSRRIQLEEVESGLGRESAENLAKISENQKKIAEYTAAKSARLAENNILEGAQKDVLKEIENHKKGQAIQEERLNKLMEIRTKLLMQLNFWKLVQLGLDRFVALDKAAEEFRKETGFTNTQMVELRKNAEDINREFVGMGVSIEKVYKAASALTNVFGRTTLVTKEALQNVSLLATNLGVSEENSAEVLSIFQGIGGATQEVAMNVIKAGAALSEKTGVPFAKVMGDVAKASGTTAMLLGANPSSLMKAAIAARALGTDLNTLANQQKNLLNYTSSINDELEASAMLGKSISFQEARRLAYEGKIEDSAKATLDMVKQAGDFNAMNLYQREALAKASGMDLKDLTKMLAVDKQREDIMLRGTPEQKKKLQDQERELKLLKERNKLDEDDLIKQGEREIRQQKMQGLMTQFNNMLEELKVLIGDILEPIITPLAKILVPTFKILGAILKLTIIPLFKMAAEPIKMLADLLSTYIVGPMTDWASGLDKVISKLYDAKDGLNWIVKTILGAGSALLISLFFGRFGPSGLIDMIKSPFKAVGSMAKTLVSKVTGGGIAGDAAKGAADAAKGTAGASKATERIPTGTGVKDFLTNLAAGLKEMGDGKVLFGALNLIPASIGLIAMIPGAIGMAAIGFTGRIFQVGARGLAAGLTALANPQVLLGTLALLGIGGAFALFGLGAKLVAEAFVSIANVIPNAIVPLTQLALISPLLYVAAGGISALAISLGALALMSIPATVASIAIYVVAKSVQKLGDGFDNVGKGMQLFTKGITNVINPIRQFSSINMKETADGMALLSNALSSFGVGSAVAGIGSFIGNFLGGDPIAKMEKLASMSDKLKSSAEAINSISEATSKFTVVDNFAKSVGILADSLNKLSDSLGKIQTEELAKLNAVSTAATATTATAAPTTTMNTAALEQKLDKLTELLVGGAVRVYLNGKDLSANLAPISK